MIMYLSTRHFSRKEVSVKCKIGVPLSILHVKKRLFSQMKSEVYAEAQINTHLSIVILLES